MEISEYPKTQWSHDDFVNQLILYTRDKYITLKSLPDKIDLNGKIGIISDELREKTDADPEKRERGITTKINTKGELVFSDEIIGAAHAVKLDADYNLFANDDLPAHYFKHFTGKASEHPGFSMHTHGDADTPFSPGDIEPILNQPESGFFQASIVITPTIKFLLMRTLDTPDLEDYQIRGAVDSWWQRLNRYSTDLLNQGLQGEGLSKPFNQEVYKINQEACQKYKLGMYTSTANNVYVRTKI